MTDRPLALEGVGRRAGGRWALRDVSLALGPGTLCGVTGANGSGKSLLLALCATLVPPSAGAVSIAGIDARRRPALARRHLGYLPADVGCYPAATVREDLAFFASAHGLRRDATPDAVDAALARWHLVDVADVPTGALSRGVRRRLGLARAVLHGPDLLLLDEPTASMDAEARALVWRELRRHADAGGAALFASHDPAELARAHRTLGLAAGRLLDGAGAHTGPWRDRGATPAAAGGMP
jgi:ABC-2 type transport system ATP-binding protein